MDKAAFDDLKRRAAELWPDLARYMDTAHLDRLKRLNLVTETWEWITVLTVDIFKR